MEPAPSPEEAFSAENRPRVRWYLRKAHQTQRRSRHSVHGLRRFNIPAL